MGWRNICTESIRISLETIEFIQIFLIEIISIPFLSLQVSIKFHKEQGLPGSNASLNLQAAPDSFCALRAVDKSVLLLKSEQQLSAESVRSLISSVFLFLSGL